MTAEKASHKQVSKLLSRKVFLLAIFVAGILLSLWTIDASDEDTRTDLLLQTRLIAKTIDIKQIKSLSNTAADLNNPDYLKLKENLASIRSANPLCRFIYIMGMKTDGSVYFIVDSEPLNSEDYSPPGQEYDESSADLLSVFKFRREVVEGPLNDKWGVWVSALVPLVDENNGKVIAALGMDIDAGVWKWELVARSALPIGLILLLLIVIVVSYAATRRVSSSIKHVFKRLFGIFVLIVVVFMAGSGALVWQQYHQRISENMATRVSEINRELKIDIGNHTLVMAMALQSITSDDSLKESLKGHDAESLLKRWKPVFEKYYKEKNITNFLFMDADRTCILRVHNPDKSGDRIDRKTVIKAEQTGEMASGLEQGELGTFTLRVVQPVFSNGELLGYIELGKQIEEILQSRLKTGLELALLVSKEQVDRSRWENSVRATGREPDWDRHPVYVTVYASNNNLSEYMGTWADSLKMDLSEKKSLTVEPTLKVLADGVEWEVSAITLQDASGINAGHLIILQDVQFHKTGLTGIFVIVGMAGMVLLVMLLSFIYVMLNRADKQIRIQQSVLVESEEQLRTLINTMPDLVCFKDDEGRWLQANNVDLKLFQIENVPYHGMKDFELADFSPFYRDAFLACEESDEKAWVEKRPYHSEETIQISDGSERVFDIIKVPVFKPDGSRKGLVVVGRDITERKRAQVKFELASQRAQALLQLNQMADATLQEITDFALEEAVRLTQSTIGYLAFLNDDESVLTMHSWSKSAMAECAIIDKPIVYPVVSTGLWGEAVRQRRPIITNDYAAANPLKKGCPQGHVLVKRHMNIPVFDGTRIVIVAGVGNKSGEYDDGDIQQLTLLMEGMWRLLERKKAEKALRDSEERWQFALEGAGDGVWDWNKDTNKVYFSHQWKAMLGYTDDEVGDDLSEWDRLVHPDDKAAAYADLERHFRRETEIYQNEQRMLCKDGSYKWILDRGKVVEWAEEGKPRRIIGTHTDITERKKSEAQKLESERRFRLLVQNSNDIIQIMDEKGIPSYISDQIFRILGYTPEERLGISSLDDIHPDDLNNTLGVFSKALNEPGTVRKVEYRYRHKDGHWVNIEAIGCNLLNDPIIKGFVLNIRDISERKLAEVQLAEKEAKFHAIYDQAVHLAGIIDLDGTLLDVNSAAKNFIGNADSSNYIGKPFWDTPWWAHSQEIQQELKTVIKKAARGEYVQFETTHKNAEGHTRYIDFSLKPVIDTDGKIFCLIPEGRDITERKQAEEEQRQLQMQLQQAQKMESVGRLAGGVAHDFNNLLTSISGNVELALSEIPKESGLSVTLSEVRKASLSAAALIRQLLAFSRRQIIEPRVVDLNVLITNMHKMLVRLIGEDIQLETLPQKDLKAVKIDPGQFEQILVNLAVNARDAMPQGGILTIETTVVDLDEEYCHTHAGVNPGSYVMLAVSDTGLGMSEEVRQHIFEPFFTTKSKGEGTGLGLATTYGAVKQAGGTIEVYSEPGEGTTFKIYLPAVNEKAEVLEADRVSEVLLKGSETVLLVEDEQMVRTLAIRLLKKMGYNVIDASNGRKALEIASEMKDGIDLLMTDVVMPGMNGRQLAEKLKEIHPETKVLFTSGYTENIIAHHGVVDEGLNFIGKPYSMNMLARKIREILDERES